VALSFAGVRPLRCGIATDLYTPSMYLVIFFARIYSLHLGVKTKTRTICRVRTCVLDCPTSIFLLRIEALGTQNRER